MSAAPQGATIGIVAILTRPVASTVIIQAGRAGEAPVSFDLPHAGSEQNDRIAFHYGLAALPGPGRYLFRVVLGTDVLATGQLDVIAPNAHS